MRKALAMAGFAAAAGWGMLRLRQISEANTYESERRGLQRRCAAVTGASSGIGAQFARQLAPLGFDLLLVGRRTELLEKLAAELTERHGVFVEVLVADLSTESGIRRVAERLASMDGLELLVNNAGFGVPGKFAEVGIAGQLDMVRVHVEASMHFMRAVLPKMISRHRGAIVNVSSLSAFVPLLGNATYSASKAYLVNFTEALDAEVRHEGIRVQALCPGLTRTDFHSRPELAGSRPDRVPGAFWGKPEWVVMQSLRGLAEGRVVVVPGLMNGVAAMVMRDTPFGGLAKRLMAMILRVVSLAKAPESSPM